MKTLIVYYSRSGKSALFAKALQAKGSYDIDRLEYAGTARVGFIKAVIEALRKRTVAITGAAHHPAEYERIIFITPIWGSSLSTPIRSYMVEHKTSIASYTLIGICGGGGIAQTVQDATSTLGKAPESHIQYTSAQIDKGQYDVAACL